MSTGERTAWAEDVPARIGALGVHATPASLVVHRRTRAERAMRVLLTVLASLLAAPVAFLVPPHFEPMALVLLAGAYMAWRAWRGEWVAEQMSGTCPRCDATLSLKAHTLLFLPHSLHCGGCRAECWIELGAAPDVDAAVRARARERAVEPPASELGGRPPTTWSPAASDWRDRRKE